ncbi:hypothetical protein HHK36_014364 [Tetracentron sinense]|uniref:Transcription initiation factor TFIID component TAF4 C-terminal domain-containing protein n=1 Tax=Tetracentron sinense TaxID=13715 RepID=A0A834ZC40_TETSI|nr:hypothetical protein HHK36_014364 [Tetracentron sinense]
MQLKTLHSKLRKYEINKEGFVRLMKNIVGDQMDNAWDSRNSHTGSLQLQLQAQASPQKHLKIPSPIPLKFFNPHSFAQLHQNGHMNPAGPSQIPTSAVQVQTASNFLTRENSDQKSIEVGHHSDRKGMVDLFLTLLIAAGLAIGLASIRPGVGQGKVAPPGTSKDEGVKKQSSRRDFLASTNMVPTNSVSCSMPTQINPTVPLRTQIPSANTLVGSGTNVRSPSRKPSSGHKKPLEALGIPSQFSSKRQKVSGTFVDQSIKQLDDVIAFSGVNLRQEEEQLFSGPEELNQASKTSQRAVQEEERLILRKTPLQKKLAQIMAKCGINRISNDVECCLSLCVEERMRGLLCNLIRLAKHNSKGDWENRQAEEVGKLQNLNKTEGDIGVDDDKDKDEGRFKTSKADKEYDKMRTTAANVAAREAVGGKDILSKWKLMAEQARQKREGGMHTAYGAQPGTYVIHKPLSTFGRTVRDNQEAEKKNPSAAAAFGTVRKFGRNQAGPQAEVVSGINVKDVIAVLEREPQMSQSTLLYCLYEKMHADRSAQ